MDVATLRATRGRTRAWVAAAVIPLAAATTALSAGPAAAQPAGVPTGHPAPVRVQGHPKPTHLPLGLQDQQTTVVVQLSGAPVTVADAESSLSSGQESQLQQRLVDRQQPVRQRVRDLGGRVLGSYQLAYNGVKVQIARGKLSTLAAMPNVVAVRHLQTFKPDNIHSVPLIGAPQAWAGVSGFRGEGIKIADIDTGIDYTHADFGGPGTPAAYQEALATDTEPADPALFGPDAPKVKGGTDLVGDDYNADDPENSTPQPDPNPLDCGGHGTHTAGTAGGFGVLADGSTFHGPYTNDTVASHDWLVGPGVAPLADIYSIRVFGCEGSTNVVVDAIEWAVGHHMDVINMSLGSPFGSPDDPSAVASANAAEDGVIVVASAGNDGPAPYLVGSPAAGDNVLSVAASDPLETLLGADLALSTGTTTPALNANGAALPTGTLPVIVLRDASGGISLGCDPQEYIDAGVQGKLVVTARGTCARVARAIFGEQAGAAAVLMVNSDDAFPPFEGQITSNPDTGEPFNVTIPFLGVPSSSGAALDAADGGTVTLTEAQLDNPGFLAPASFSSGGPTGGSSALTPDVTAPGVSIESAGMGTGTGAAVMSGTSMAAPHTTGTAALVRQAHPRWHKVRFWDAAIAETADPGLVNAYSTRIAGSGLIQAQDAVKTQVVALGTHSGTAVNFGFAELRRDFRKTATVRLRNFGKTPATFAVSTSHTSGSPHTAVVSPGQVTVPAHGSRNVRVTLRVPAETAGTSAAFADVAGLLTFTPTGDSNSGVTLRMPYYLVPQSLSNISTSISARTLVKRGSATARITNRHGAATGTADWYAWGLSDSRDQGLRGDDVQAVGAQALPGLVVFAVSTYHRWSTPSAYEFDVFVDVNGDGTDDYDVVAADLGLLTTGVPTGQMATAVFDQRTGAGTILFLADAPFDSSTLLLPATIDQLCGAGSPCLSESNPRLSYHVQSFGLIDGTTDVPAGTAAFNVFEPAVSTGMFDTVAPNARAIETVTLDRDEFASTPALGLMVVSHDDRAGREAQVIGVDVPGSGRS